MTEYDDSFQRHMLREMRQQTALLQIAVNLLSEQKKSYEREIRASGATLRTTATTKESGSFAEEVDKGFEQMKKFSKEAAALVASGALDDPKKPVKPEIKAGQKWRTLCGLIVTIKSNDGDDYYPWISDTAATYTDDGRYWDDGSESEYDLVELIEDAPAQQEKTLEQHARECANKIKQAIDDMYKATGKPIGVISVEWIKYDTGEYFLKDVRVKVQV